MKALLPNRNVRSVQWGVDPHDDLMRADIAHQQRVCDVKGEAVIPAANKAAQLLGSGVLCYAVSGALSGPTLTVNLLLIHDHMSALPA